MVAQVVAAPVMAVGNVTTAALRSVATVTMRTGSSMAKAGMSAARATGSALRTGATRSVSTAAKASKGLFSSTRAGPLASRFNALSTARTGAANAASRATPSAPQVAGRSPASQAIERAVRRADAGRRGQPAKRSHSVDDRDRAIILRMAQADLVKETEKNMFLEAARSARIGVRKGMAAGRVISGQGRNPRMAGQIAQKEHEDRTSIAMER